MPFEGEFAGYRSLRRLTEEPRVKELLSRSVVFHSSDQQVAITPHELPPLPENHNEPDFVVAIDGSSPEVPVKNGYPGAAVGYVTVASVLLNLKLLSTLDEERPIDPVEFRKTEDAATVDAALPGCNVRVRGHASASISFREAIYERLIQEFVDEEERISLLDTYEFLLAQKPNNHPPACPYAGSHDCDQSFQIPLGHNVCPCPAKRPLWSTDALRIQERFNELGPNEEVFGQVRDVWERLLFVHLLRSFERRNWLKMLPRIAFFMDGPLAMFGMPAWLSKPIGAEVRRINSLVREASNGNNLLIVGIEKTGSFVAHFEQIDQMEDGTARFSPGSYFMPTDAYIKERILPTDSTKQYGKDTYFGRKFFYKTHSGARLVATMPFLNQTQDQLITSDATLYPQLAPTCVLLDKLVTSRFPNAVSPLVNAHAHAAIPLQLGAKVLQQLARALMKTK